MNLPPIPWLELAVAVALFGSPVVSRLRDPDRAYRWCLVFTGMALAFAALAWLQYDAPTAGGDPRRWGVQPYLFGRPVFALDELNAPLIPAVALLHFLTALATARAHMRRFSFSWSLAAEALGLAAFSCKEPWVLIGLLAASTLPPYVELRNRRRPTRVYVLHMALVSLKVTPRERVAVLTFAALVLGVGLFPQAGVASRNRAAVDVLDDRRTRPERAGPAAGGPPPVRRGSGPGLGTGRRDVQEGDQGVQVDRLGQVVVEARRE